jgi:D-3-phosphoglycerate dehydrogenase / 2-oxoglutarate reductase
MIIALICGRAENQPFPGRNTFPLLGRPLMVYPLLAALNSAQVDRVYLSTDDEGMARVARHTGVEVIMRQPELVDSDSVALEEVINSSYHEIKRQIGQEPEGLVVMLANAPTVTNGLIDQAVEQLRSSSALDAVMTVSMHNEFHPRYALQLQSSGRILPYPNQPKETVNDAYFSDSLLWVLRTERFFQNGGHSLHPKWIVDTTRHNVAALVHEGYGDVDYPWQIPLVEEWLRRSGFTETDTPYELRAKANIIKAEFPHIASPGLSGEGRVLITTVPFGQADRRPLDLLEARHIEYVINPTGRRLKEEELAGMIGDFGILIAGTEPITARVMEAAPNLRLIARVGIGLDNVDLVTARKRGIQVTYTPDAPSPAVAELVVGQMISLLRDIAGADRNMRNGIWHRFMGKRLSELTVGVIGVGRVGKLVIRHLTGGFPGVRILANDLHPDTDFGNLYKVQWTEKEQIYQQADLITLHVPLTSLTRQLITRREIEIMKPSTLLINTSRGNMINEHDLAAALRSGQLGGAAIDVFEREPYSGELSTVERCLLTSHMGSMSQDCRFQMELEATEEAIRFLRNEPLKSIVPDEEYQSASRG